MPFVKRSSRRRSLVLFTALGMLSAASSTMVEAAGEKPAGPAAPPRLSVSFIEGRPFAEVLRRARTEKKPIMVDLYATWCGPCKLLDRSTFADEEFGAWAKRTLVSAKIDAEKGEGRRLARRYAVNSFPTVLFLDPSGDELDRLTGAYAAESFRANAEMIMGRRSQLQLRIEQLGREWSMETALGVVSVLAQRNDLPRLRPLIFRLVREDLDLAHSETLEALGALSALEDYDGHLSAETADMVSSFLPSLGDDPRRGWMAGHLARELARAGEAVRTRTLVEETLRVIGEGNPLAPDLVAALGRAQRKAGLLREATASFARALKLGEAAAKPPAWAAEKKIELAAALASASKSAEAETTLRDALPAAGNDAGLLSAGARVWLTLKKPAEATAVSRRAVFLSQGEDAVAQAALGASLLASGDRKGAAAAFGRALEFSPEDGEIRREMAGLKKKG
jgi:thioredoxin-like negative regulator of GroEL/Flp pilus assembly protein TadD